MARTREQQKAIFAKRTKSGKLITITKGTDIFQNKDIFKVSGAEILGSDSQFTQSRERAIEIANAKVESENKRFETLKKMKST